MNEQIEKLLKQANPSFNKSDIVGPWYTEDIEKFAELIVKECANVGSRSMYPDSDPDYVGRKIKQHFGVEE